MTYTATKIQWFGVFLNFTKYVQMSLVFESVCKESMGGGGGGKCPRRFQLSRNPLKFLKQYLPNVATFTKMFWGTRFWKKFCVKGITCCHGNHIFDAMFTQILTF